MMNNTRPIDIILPEAKRAERITLRLCALPPLGCGGTATDFRDPLSRKEYNISGLCQDCQDAVFGR